MNSRFVPITVAIVSSAIAAFFILYFVSPLRWVIASPMLVFVTWPAFKVGFFAPQSEVDRMTGVKPEDEPINLFLLAIQLITFSRYIFYGVAIYIGFIKLSYFLVFAIALLIGLVKIFEPRRFQPMRNSLRHEGYLSSIKFFSYLYIADLIIASILYGIGHLGSV